LRDRADRITVKEIVLKITQTGPAETEFSQLVQNDKRINPARRDGPATAEQSGESTKIDISAQGRDLQRIAELAHRGDELRADKVRHIKKQIETGQFHADFEDVSKSIVRSEVARLLEKP
jgi:flagellar biosynthesis anti-sigma factor FlgM